MPTFLSRNKTIHLGKIMSLRPSKTVNTSLTSWRNLPGSRSERKKEPLTIPSSESNMHPHTFTSKSFSKIFWTLLVLYLNGINIILVESKGSHLKVCFTWVASRIKSWMIICSSLERHSLSLLIRVTVKASQFMDSSRLGQYTNSSSAWRNERTHYCSLSDTVCATEKSSGSKNCFDK